MSHLIICLGKDPTEFQERIYSIIKKFDNVYVIGEGIDNIDIKSIDTKQKVSLLLMPDIEVKELSDALRSELKSLLSKDKINDLDIAVNIFSGSGKIHSAVISAVIQLGYGIRLVDIDEKGDILEI